MRKGFLILLFLAQLAYGQVPYHYWIDQSRGLPSNSVYDIFQDKKGFMWFATNDGICRYDGNKFISYFSYQQPSRAGSCIAEDKFGRIWYSNFDGYLYYIKNGVLGALKQRIPRGYYHYGVVDEVLFVLYKDGVMRYDLKSLRPIGEIKIDEEHIFFSHQANGKFYILGKVLYEVTPRGQLKVIELPSDFYSFLKHAIIMQRTPDGLLFASKVVPYNYLWTNGTFRKSERQKELEYIQNVTDVNGKLWFCSPNGAFQLNNLTRENGQAFFRGFNISSVFRDDRGNHWFATLNKGLVLVPDFRDTIVEIPSRPTVMSAYRDGLLVATADDAIYKVDLDKRTRRLMYKGSSNHAIDQLFVDSLSGELAFTSNQFKLLDRTDQLTVQAHVAVKDVRKVDGKYYSFAATGYSGLFSTRPSLKSEWDRLYGANLGASQNFRETTLLKGLNGKATLYNPQNKTIYYATNLGLFCQGLTFKSELKFDNSSLFIKNLELHEGVVYGLATNGRLFSVDPANAVKPFEPKIGNGGSPIWKISIKANLMYLFTAEAVYEYHLDTQKKTALIAAGKELEVSDIAFYKNKIVFATAKGLLLKERRANRRNAFSTLVLDGVVVNDSLANPSLLGELRYDQNNIAINYSLLVFTPNEKRAVYYRINESKWQPLDEQGRSLRLNSLSPGKYQVGFKVVSTLGVKEEQVHFYINKPFWLSTWFLSGLVFVFLLSVYAFYRYKILQNDKSNLEKLARLNLENNLNQSKLKAIKSQMNPHFFYNALNTIQSYILANDKMQAVGYLSKFSLLTRSILEMSEKEYIDLKEEIKTITIYLDLEKARFDGDFEYEVVIHGSLDEDGEIKMPTLLLQPFLENAVKHGLLHKQGDKRLRIVLNRKEEVLKIAIDDNGIGRKKSRELNRIKNDRHQSFAIDAMQTKVDLLNQRRKHKISIHYTDKINASGYSLGTTVTIQIPLTDS